ncbi:MAG: heme o synthase [Planctomycetaceae bacterium]
MSLDVMVADPVPGAPVLIRNANPSEARSARHRTADPLVSASNTNSEFPVPAISLLDTSTSLARDFLELTKPRIVTMILVTTLVAAVVAAGSSIAAATLFHLLVGVALVAGSAGAMNQVWEREIDREMERTRRRPVPAGRMTAWAAALFSVAIGVGGTAYLTYFLGAIPAIVGAVTWITYVPIYTPMKTRSAWNTTIGAVSGALPVLIGYTAAGGSLADLRGWLLVGVLVAWQYPHFMAIAWLYRRQYAEAGFRMTTTVEPTGRSAGWQSVAGMLLLVSCLLGLALGYGDLTSWQRVVLVACLILASYPMTKAAVRFASDRNDGTARKLLRASLLQLPASLLLVTAAALLG